MRRSVAAVLWSRHAALLCGVLAAAACEFDVGPLGDPADTDTSTTGGTSSTTTGPGATSDPGTSAITGQAEESGTTSAFRSSGDVELDCCTPQDAPGCGDDSIESCVCDRDRFCCEEQWDAECVQKVGVFGCGVCEPMETLGDCCLPFSGPGCSDPSVSSCVCDLDPFCCQGGWDAVCADLVTSSGCGECANVKGCCQTQPGPSCGAPEIEACVCAARPECCTDSWDASCVAAIELLGCASCPYEDTKSCCAPHFGGGCDVDGVEECVCAEDSYCCELSWDETCVGEVEVFGCGSCGGTGDTGTSSSGESGAFG